MLWIGVGVLVSIAIAIVTWAWFEAGWLRCRVLEVELEGVPRELDGLRIAHLSDFHLGTPGRGSRAVEDAIRWVVERRPDLVCVTGDIVSRRSGRADAVRLLAALEGCFVVLGNHDLDRTRDPFSQRVDLEALERVPGVRLLGHESARVELRGRSVQVVGVDPQAYADKVARPDALVDESASLRVLLCHFPGIVHRIPAAFQLILAGHFHAGQITVPYPGGRLRLAHLSASDVEGIYRYGPTTLHVSPGLGTTFLPFRLFARPEVTELVVRSKA